MKRLYLLFFVIILVGGAFALYTFVIKENKSDISDDDGEQNEQEDDGNSKVQLEYKDYSISSKLATALAKVDTTDVTIYFYNQEVDCSSTNVFNEQYEGLLLTVKADKTVLDGAVSSIKTAQIIKHDISGNYVSISGIPDTTNSITAQQGTTNISGNINLVWTNRSAKGSFDAVVCE